MRLRLQFPPTPENAEKLAGIVVEAALRVEGIELDYLPSSLKSVDAILCKLRAQGAKSEQIAETLFSFGCYVGEVLVKHMGAAWVLPEESAIPPKMRHLFPFMVVQTPRRMVWNPIGKAFKLFDEGMSESTEYFFHVAQGREIENV